MTTNGTHATVYIIRDSSGRAVGLTPFKEIAEEEADILGGSYTAAPAPTSRWRPAG